MVSKLQVVSLPVIALSLLALSACASDEQTADRYQEPDLPSDQVATFRRIQGVFGEPIDGKAWRGVEVKLLPGSHTIGYMSFEAEAGHRYELHGAWGGHFYRSWLKEREFGATLGVTTIRNKASVYDWHMPNREHPSYPRFPLPAGRDRQVVAVRSLEHDNLAEWNDPIRGVGAAAASSAGDGAAIGLSLCTNNMACIIIGPMLALVGALAGAAHGDATGHADEEVTAGTTTLKEALRASDYVGELDRAVIDRLKEVGSEHYEVRSLTMRSSAPPKTDLALEGVDAVLELQVLSLSLFVPRKEIEPDANYTFWVRTKLTDGSGAPIGPPQIWGFYSEAHNYYDLASNDAQLLRQLVDQGYPEVADLIVSNLFFGSD